MIATTTGYNPEGAGQRSCRDRMPARLPRPEEQPNPVVGRPFGGRYNPGMRITLERTGGFAGRRVQIDLDSRALPAPRARQLRSLLAKSRFFDLPVLLDAGAPGADRFHYRVTVEEDNRSHTVDAGEAAVPDDMRPLLDWLLNQGT